MNRTLAAAMVAALSLPAPLGAAPPQAQSASVAGKASKCTGQAIGNSPAQVRSLSSGQTAGTTTTASDGTFRFAGLPAGNYVVEVLNSAQQVVATSATISVPASGSIMNVAVREGNCSPAAAAVGGGGLSRASIIGIVAAASIAGIGGIVSVTNNNGSPSQ